MRWLEKRFYIFLLLALVALAIAAFFLFRAQHLSADSMLENLRNAPREKVNEVVAGWNQAQRDRAEAAAHMGQALIVAVLFSAIGVGLCMRHVGVTHRTLINGTARTFRQYWRHILLIGMPLVIIIVLITIDVQTQAIRGVMRGERFCGWRPASYWRNQLREDFKDNSISPEMRRAFTKGEPEAGYRILLDLTQDGDVHVRSGALALLGRSNPQEPEVLMRVEAGLSDKEPKVRFYAVRLVPDLWSNRDDARRRIGSLLKDPNPQVANVAVRAFWHVDPDRAVEHFAWKSYESKSWGFSIVMPRDIEESVAPVMGLAELKTHKFAAPFNDSFFAVAVTEYPLELLADSTEESRHETALRNLADAVDGHVSQDGPIEQRGRPGREVTLHARGKGTYRARTFWRANRLYQVVVTTHPLSGFGPEHQYFLDSFQITERPRHR